MTKFDTSVSSAYTHQASKVDLLSTFPPAGHGTLACDATLVWDTRPERNGNLAWDGSSSLGKARGPAFEA